MIHTMYIEIPILVGYSAKVIDLLFSIHYNSANLSSMYTHHGRIQIIPPGDPGIDCLAIKVHAFHRGSYESASKRVPRGVQYKYL